jgi:Tfp pilus assembly protein PilE
MGVLRFRFTVRQLLIVVAILSLPLAIGGYRYSAGRKAAVAEAKAHLAQAKAAHSTEKALLQKARDAAGSAIATTIAQEAADHRKQAKTSEKVAGEILDRYGMKPPASKR